MGEKSLETAIAPLANRLEIAGKMGCNITLDADAAKATGKALRLLARYSDISDAQDLNRRQMRKFFLELALYAAALVGAAHWLNS